MSSNCFHCDLAVPDGSVFNATVLDQERHFCCPGCLAIAESICRNGLEQFYQYRTTNNHKAETILPQEIFELEALDEPSVLQTISESKDNINSLELGIEGITCAACGWLIKTQIARRPEVKSIQVNTATRRAHIEFDTDAPLSPILKNIRELGYKAFPFSEDKEEKQLQQEASQYNRRLIVAGLGAMQIMMFATGLYIGDFQDISASHAYFLHGVSGLLATPVVFYSALPFFKSAWFGLKHQHFGMNLPVSIAILAGYFASLFSLLTNGQVFYFDSVVMFTFFLLLGRYLEQRTRLKAVLKQQNFKRLLPLSVTRKNADGNTQVIATSAIIPGDRLIINAGSVIPVDGVLIDSQAEINEAVISGEFLPVNKLPGDKIFSGSTNMGGSLLLEATCASVQSRLHQLIQLQHDSENIQSQRATLADKIASGYVIGILVLTVIVGAVWMQIDSSRVFPVILSLLIVSCPCALSLATPAAVAAAITRLTDLGLMVKSSDLLAKLSRTTHLFFDKTGTLTMGEMHIVDILAHQDESTKRCLQIAASLESISAHPIAHAFKKDLQQALPMEQTTEVIAGGLIGQLKNDKYYLGKRLFVETHSGVDLILPDQNVEATHQPGYLSIYLVKNDQHIATFQLADTINQTAARAVQLLQNKNIDITLLSGDSSSACQSVATSLGIGQVIANATPESKLAVIKKTKSSHNIVLMIGDGVNDIGALGQSDIGITMGSASHLSRAASSAVLVTHDLTVLNQAIDTAIKLDRIVTQNLTWAVIYNLCAVPFAAAGLIPAWLAAIGMTSSSLIVVLNALRLRR